MFLVNIVSPVSAYSYSGHKWSNGYANYQIDSYTVPYDFETQIYAARSTWNAVNFPFYFDQTTSTNVISYASLGSNSILASTDVKWSGSSISKCTEVFNSDIGWQWSTSGQPLHYDVQSVALHEFGHWLSLNHSAYTSAVMYPTLNSGEVKRSLTSDDTAGIQHIYP
jgi:hypothetical protein